MLNVAGTALEDYDLHAALVIEIDMKRGGSLRFTPIQLHCSDVRAITQSMVCGFADSCSRYAFAL
jgi:hypothetical protein